MNAFCLNTRGAWLRHTALVLATGVGLSGTALAQDASQLGKTLTPMGAEKAGNAAGTIPAWDGGMTKPMAGHKPGGHYADPFAADQPVMTITAANAESQKDKLTPGQLALFKAYPTYKMVIYPTRRTAAFPVGFIVSHEKQLVLAIENFRQPDRSAQCATELVPLERRGSGHAEERGDFAKDHARCGA
jgi:hypothetical protein